MPDPIPAEIRRLADERARARRARDWATADRLKAELEEAGWRVVDAGTMYSLERRPPTVVEVDGQTRYGTADAVPSRLDEPALAGVSVVIVVNDRADELAWAVAALRTHAPRAQVIVVADGPDERVAADVDALADGVEVIRLAGRLGEAAARNAGIRRAAHQIVVVMDPRVRPEDDLLGALAAALADPTVAVAGIRGLDTTDLVHFELAPAGRLDVVAVDSLAQAFRRSDYAARGPLDGAFVVAEYLDPWWCLVLRDVPEDAGVDAVPRRAMVVPTAFAFGVAATSPVDERLSKKQRYRFLKWFATRRDLLVENAAGSDVPL